MANESLTDLSSLIKQYAESQEQLCENLAKLQAMIKVAIDDNFSEQSQETIHNYLWVINEILYQSQALSNNMLSSMIKAL